TIKTYDAFSRLSIFDINRVANFLFQNFDKFRDSKSAIRKSLMYAAKEIPGLGGYVFVLEENDEILGAVVVNRTGMNEYLSENILVYVAVKRECRGKGLGKKLIEHTIKYCKGDIAIHINKENPAINLFKDKG